MLKKFGEIFILAIGWYMYLELAILPEEAFGLPRWLRAMIFVPILLWATSKWYGRFRKM